MGIPEVLNVLVAALEEAPVPYALAGGLASNLWVSEERTRETFDIDLAVAASEADAINALKAALERRGLSVLGPTLLPFKRATIRRFVAEGVIVDFIRPRDEGYVRKAFSRLETAEMSRGKRIPVLSPEDLFLFKALAKRGTDLQPMTAMAEATGFNREYVESWARKLGVWSFAKQSLRVAR